MLSVYIPWDGNITRMIDFGRIILGIVGLLNLGLYKEPQASQTSIELR
jgi:hypothetical protein